MQPKQSAQNNLETDGVTIPPYYNRESFDTRINGLSEYQKKYFDNMLNIANGWSVSTLQNCIKSPESISDDKVESVMRDLAIIIARVKMEIDPKKDNLGAGREIMTEINNFLRKYNFNFEV